LLLTNINTQPQNLVVAAVFTFLRLLVQNARYHHGAANHSGHSMPFYYKLHISSAMISCSIISFILLNGNGIFFINDGKIKRQITFITPLTITVTIALTIFMQLHIAQRVKDKVKYTTA
jgi:hypothetical protein